MTPTSSKTSTTRSRSLNESAMVTVMMTSSLPLFAIFLFLLSVHHSTKNLDEGLLINSENDNKAVSVEWDGKNIVL